MRLQLLLAGVWCSTPAMCAALPAPVQLNLPSNATTQKIVPTPDGGFLVLINHATILHFSAAGIETSTWTSPNQNGVISDLVVDGQGNIYVGGNSIISSPSASGCLVKLDPSSKTTLASACFGDRTTTVTAMALDQQGNIYLAGSTQASAFPNAFNPSPPLVGSPIPTYAYAIKVPPTLDQIVYSVLLGGTTAECHNEGIGPPSACGGSGGEAIPPSTTVAAIAVDSSDSITIAGNSLSNGFPLTSGAIAACYGDEGFGAYESDSGFVSKFSPDGSALVYSTCLSPPGPATNTLYTMQLAPDGDAVITLFGNIAGVAGGVSLAKLNANGSGVLFSGQFGQIGDLAVDTNGNIWITGLPYLAFGIVGANVSSLTPLGYVAEIAADGSGILQFNLIPSAAAGVSIALAGDQVLTLGSTEVVSTPNIPPEGQVAGIFNAISNRPETSVAPGEFLTIWGANLGNAADIQIDFDGVAAPILYAAPNQVNLIAPWSPESALNIRNNGVLVKSIPISIAAANPQLLALVNADGSVNSPGNPAPVGSTVTAYLNGASYGTRASSLSTNGSSFQTIPLSPSMTASAGVRITYQGSAPGELYAVQQVNLLIDSPPANSLVTLTQGTASLQFPLSVTPAH